MKQLRAFLESILFVGVDSGVRPSWQPQGIDRLNLSQRTFAQKMRAWFMPALQCLVLLAFTPTLVYLVRPTVPPKQLTPEQVSRKVPSNFPQAMQINNNRDVEVLEVHLEESPALSVAGSVRNNSAKTIQK